MKEARDLTRRSGDRKRKSRREPHRRGGGEEVGDHRLSPHILVDVSCVRGKPRVARVVGGFGRSGKLIGGGGGERVQRGREHRPSSSHDKSRAAEGS